MKAKMKRVLCDPEDCPACKVREECTELREALRWGFDKENGTCEYREGVMCALGGKCELENCDRLLYVVYLLLNVQDMTARAKLSPKSGEA